MVLGSYRNLTPHKDPQEYEIAASKYIQSSWAAFIRSPTHGLQMEHGWPQFRPNSEYTHQTKERCFVKFK